jgi:hypothetical protein
MMRYLVELKIDQRRERVEWVSATVHDAFTRLGWYANGKAKLLKMARVG